MAERLLVYGGRGFGCPKTTEGWFERVLADTERLALWEALDTIHEQRRVLLVIHGAAWGADTCRERWAKRVHVPTMAFPADWYPGGVYDNGAGPKRNIKMTREGHPTVSVECPGGKGTAHERGLLQRLAIPMFFLDVAARKLRRLGRP